MGLIKAILSGWNEGKGHKYLKKKNYEKALRYYILSLKYSENEGGEAVLLEQIAKTFILLDNNIEAMDYAKRSFELYKKQEHIAPLFKSGMKRMHEMLEKIERTMNER